MLRRALFAVFCCANALLSFGCGAPAPAPARPAAAVAHARTCPPGSDDTPKDARPRMSSLQGAIRKCYSLATGGAATDVKVEITIAPSGEVREAKVLDSNGHEPARACLERTMRGAKFASFCGPDVSLRWTYALR